jgi:hypothetical protein
MAAGRVPSALADHLEALECALHDPVVRGDRARLSALLDDDFAEIGSSGGCFDRATALAELPAERAQVEILAEDVSVLLLDAHVAQVRYRSAYVINGERQRTVLRSSLWRLRAGAWRMVFHQGTPVPDP